MIPPCVYPAGRCYEIAEETFVVTCNMRASTYRCSFECFSDDSTLPFPKRLRRPELLLEWLHGRGAVHSFTTQQMSGLMAFKPLVLHRRLSR